MRIISPTGTITASQWAAAAAELCEDSSISSDLAEVSNTTQSPPRAGGSGARTGGDGSGESTSSGQQPSILRPWDMAAQEVSIVPAVAAGTAVDDCQSFEPPAKLMRLVPPAQVPSALDGTAPVISMQPVPRPFNAAANVQSQVTATTTNRPGARARYNRVTAPTWEEQSTNAITAVQQWAGLSRSDRELAGSLFEFMNRTGAILVYRNGQALEAAPIAALEWLLIPDEERKLLVHVDFSLERSVASARYVLAEGMMTELGAALFTPILRQAGLPLPPVAESNSAWEERVRPIVQDWSRLPLDGRPELNMFVAEASPANPSTVTQKSRLEGIDFLMVRMECKHQQVKPPPPYQSIHAFSQARHISRSTLRVYINGRRGSTSSSHFDFVRTLLPEHLKPYAPAALGGLQAQAQPPIEQR